MGMLTYSRKKLVPCPSTSDIISDLPRNIIDNILICLPLQEAAKTSILSKNWRYKWHYIPQLVFNHNNFFRSRSSKSPLEIWFQVYQILLFHRVPLHKFVLSFKDVEIDSYILNQIVLYLSGKDIQEVTIRPSSNTQYRLCSTLFQCTQLKHLNLSSCEIRLPPELIGFSRLISLQLHQVDLSANDFKTFISKSPLLEHLVLKTTSCGGPFELDALNLKFLYFECSVGGSICFKNVPVLSTVMIKTYDRLPVNTSTNDEEATSNIVEVFDSLPAIDYLDAGRDFLLYLSVDIIQEKLPKILINLQCVMLGGLCFNSPKEVQCALLLMRSAPNLQELNIKVCTDIDNESHILLLREALDRVEDSFNHLKEVTIEDFGGTEPELEFVKFLLSKSSVLQTIYIQPPKGMSANEKLEVMKVAIRFQRASPTAEIIFL